MNRTDTIAPGQRDLPTQEHDDLVGDILDLGRGKLDFWRAGGDLVRLESQLAARAGFRLVGCLLALVAVGGIALLWTEVLLAYLLLHAGLPPWAIASAMIAGNVLLAWAFCRAITVYRADLQFDGTRSLLRESFTSEGGA